MNESMLLTEICSTADTVPDEMISSKLTDGSDDGVVVSILCAAYNHEDYIAQALEGFVKQKTNFKFEAIVHDDASTDNTAEIIKDYASRYPDIIKTVLQKENQYSKGLKYLHNSMHPLARGKYIAMCEGDDYWTDPYKLQKQLEFMEKHPECSVSYHAAELFDVRVNKKTGEIRMFNETYILTEDKLFFFIGEVAPTASLMYVKKYMDDPPDFYYESPVIDIPMALILSYHGRVGYIDEVMAVRNYWVPNSWTKKFNEESGIDGKIIYFKAMIKLLYDFNTYSKQKYDLQVRKIMLQFEFELLKLQGKKPFSDREFRDLFRSFGILDRIKIRMSYRMPRLTEKVRNAFS